MSEIDEKNKQQKEKIAALSFNMRDLEYKKSVLNEELQNKQKRKKIMKRKKSNIMYYLMDMNIIKMNIIVFLKQVMK